VGAMATLVRHMRNRIGHASARVMFRNTHAQGVEEIHTILSFAASVDPAVIQRAVDEQLGLPHGAPPVIGKMHVSETRTGVLRVALGSKIGTEWTGAATFQSDGCGGTMGTYRVTNWTVSDRFIPSTQLTEGMRRVREQIATVVAAQGGRSQTLIFPDTESN